MATKLFGIQIENHDGIEPYFAEDGVFEEDDGDETPAPADDTPPEDAKEAGFYAAMKAERAKRQELESRLAQFEQEQAEKARKAAEEQGEYKRLYEETTAKAASLEEEVNKYRAAEQARIEKVEARNEAALAELPENLRALVPEGMSPDAKAEQIAKLAKLASNDLPTGSRAGGGPKAPKEPIPPECSAEAQRHGKDPQWWFDNIWKPRQSRKT